MPLKCWFQDDVRDKLAGLARQAARREDGEYGQGYLDALGDVAASFGLPVQNDVLMPTLRVSRPELRRGEVTIYREREGTRP